MRIDGRTVDQLRQARCQTGFNVYAEGSSIFELGHTRVHCTASLSNLLPRWRRDSGLGWINAEYRMLPRSTQSRVQREGRSDVRGRTSEIQRLVGRSLRSVVDMKALGHRQLTVDCDVLQADGGTRTAAINGGFVAMVQAMDALVRAGRLRRLPITELVAAVSVGIVDGVPMLDLAYDEDSRAQVDLNVVMTESGRLIEVQGTAEGEPFSRAELTAMLDLAEVGIQELIKVHRATLGGLEITLP